MQICLRLSFRQPPAICGHGHGHGHGTDTDCTAATPLHLPQLIGPFQHYLWILKTTHSGADMDVALEMAKGALDGDLQWNLYDMLSHRDDWWVPGKLVELRARLRPYREVRARLPSSSSSKDWQHSWLNASGVPSRIEWHAQPYKRTYRAVMLCAGGALLKKLKKVLKL